MVQSDNKDMAKFITLALEWSPLVEELGLTELKNHKQIVKMIEELGWRISKNDPAHRWNHLTDVLKNASRCHAWEQDQCGVTARAAEYFMATLYHDSFAGVNREMHHVLGASHFENAVYPHMPKEWQYSIDGVVVCKMIEWHRSSILTPRGLPRWVYLFAVADKGPMKYKQVIDRSVDYQKHHFPESDAIAMAFAHCREKFGRHGYAFRDMHPEYLSVFGEELVQFLQKLEDPLAEDKYRAKYA